MVGGRLLGFGAAQPVNSISSGELGERFGRSAEWVEARTGIQAVRRLAAGEQLIDLAMAAAADAIGRSRLAGATIDVVVAATCSSRQGTAPLAPRLAQKFAPNAAPLDLNGACSGFCYAVGVADALISGGSAEHVLIVAAEHMSGLIAPDDVGTAIIFGDGAGAAVVGPALAEQVMIGPIAWGSDGAQADLIAFDDADEYMGMQGRQVFRWAVETVHETAAAACAKVGVALADVEVFVPHQANLRITNALVSKLGLEHAIVATDIVNSGNTSAASIPIALTRLAEGGDLHSGQLALLLGFGAGLACAAQVVRLP